MKMLLFLLLITSPAQARDGLCDYQIEWCESLGVHGSSAPAYPSKSSSFNINPGTVPTEDTFGIQGIVTKKNEWDLSLVKGTGRVGAALSATNNEETFFGPPGFELDVDFLARKKAGDKYVSQKITVATAVSVYKNDHQGFKKFQVDLGVSGKYNKLTQTVWPGAGVSGIWGPFTFGYSMGKDEFLVDFSAYGSPVKEKFRYDTQTFSGGIYLNSLAVDYSRLYIFANGQSNITVDLITASLLFKRVILSASRRDENSQRWAYDYSTQTLTPEELKREYFGGVQVALTKSFMAGVFYNYYLLHEYSLGLTFFL